MPNIDRILIGALVLRSTPQYLASSVQPAAFVGRMPPHGRGVIRGVVTQRNARERVAVRFGEPVTAQEVIFGARATDRRVFLVTVDEELDLAFAEPFVDGLLHGRERADILPAPFNAIEDHVVRVMDHGTRLIEMLEAGR